MSSLVGSLTTELRITGRIVRETVMGLKRTGWMNVIILVTMSFILSIFGALLAIIIQTGVLVKTIGSEMEISVYLKDGMNPREARAKIQRIPNLRRITLVTKESAWQDMQKEYPLPDIENPLPDTLHLQVTTDQAITQTVQRLQALAEVESVEYPKKVLDKIRGITKGVSIIGTMMALVLAIMTLFIINNTIHLLIQAKSREIEILRMMGVGNWYIRLPFLFQGALYGLGGALVSYFPLSLVGHYLNQFFIYLSFAPNPMVTPYVMAILIMMGILVGSGGAAVAVRKYLHV